MSDAPYYDSAERGPKALEEFRDVVRYRHLIYAFVKRDITTRYKRSFLGVAWTMLNPLGTMIIMVIVFSQLFVTTPGYPVYVLSGLVFWNCFAQATSAAPQTLLWSGSLMHRVYIPRTTFAFTALGASIVNLVLSFVPLILVMFATGKPPGPEMIVLPYAILMLMAFSLGLGLLLSGAVAQFPDILDIYGIVLVAWMYVSAIFYPYEIIPEQYRWWFFNLNPIYHLLLLFRDPIYYGNWPSLKHVAAATIVALVTLVWGWFAFTSKADELAYRL
jgi:ABC-type polysaccharide/polyol phosphate export permease